MPERRPSFQIVDNHDVTEVYVNKFVSMTNDGGALIVTMGTSRFTPERGGQPSMPDHVDVHVTMRLALSPPAAAELARALSQMSAAIRKKAATGKLPKLKERH